MLCSDSTGGDGPRRASRDCEAQLNRRSSLPEFQVHTTTTKRWPVLNCQKSKATRFFGWTGILLIRDAHYRGKMMVTGVTRDDFSGPSVLTVVTRSGKR